MHTDFIHCISIIIVLNISQAIIYCNTRHQVEYLYQRMVEADFAISYIHGDQSQLDRNLVMKEFRSGATRILITTDLLSRGIDIQSVSIVINYELPYNRECYIHRIGRSGRMGRKGVAINFITPRDVEKMKDIEEFYHTDIQPLPLDIIDLV